MGRWVDGWMDGSLTQTSILGGKGMVRGKRKEGDFS